MTDLTDEVRASLIEAGIGKRLHDMRLADVQHGQEMLAYLNAKGALIRGGQCVAFQGVGLTDAITMLARALHINGVGCKVTPLVRLRNVIRDAEFREVIDEVDALFILNAQDTTRSNPLHDSVAAEIEYVIRRRLNNRKATIMQLAVPSDVELHSLPNVYWTEEMIDTIRDQFDLVTLDKLKERYGE